MVMSPGGRHHSQEGPQSNPAGRDNSALADGAHRRVVYRPLFPRLTPWATIYRPLRACGWKRTPSSDAVGHTLSPLTGLKTWKAPMRWLAQTSSSDVCESRGARRHASEVAQPCSERLRLFLSLGLGAIRAVQRRSSLRGNRTGLPLRHHPLAPSSERRGVEQNPLLP